MKRGFTLIEIIVAISISLLLTGGVISSYTSFNDNQKVKHAALTLKNDLRFVINKAVSGDKPEDCAELAGYRMSFTQSGYSYRGVCTPDAGNEFELLGSLPTGASFSPEPQSVFFEALSARPDAAQVITIVGSNGQEARVSIYSTGVVGEGSLAPTPTPIPDTGASGDGLTGYYYDVLFSQGPITGDPRMTRVDERVVFNWGAGSPHPFIPVNTFSVKWVGFVKPPYSGSYTITFATDDGCRIFFDGQLKTSDKKYWKNGKKNCTTGALNLTANKVYPIQLDMYEYNKNSYAYLSWSKKKNKVDANAWGSKYIEQMYLYSQ